MQVRNAKKQTVCFDILAEQVTQPDKNYILLFYEMRVVQPEERSEKKRKVDESRTISTRRSTFLPQFSCLRCRSLERKILF